MTKVQTISDKKKTTFKIGTRVKHKNNPQLNEGVVVWVYSQEKGVLPKYDGKIYLVFWSNNSRGVYRVDEIEKNNEKFLNLEEFEEV